MHGNIGLVLGKFHHLEVSEMLAEAEQTAAELSLTIGARSWVPGSMEAPLAAKRLLAQGSIDAVVVLGIIEHGETLHGTVMGQAVTAALIGLQLAHMKPVGMGILGPGIFPSQIAPRLRPYARSAVSAVHHMLTTA